MARRFAGTILTLTLTAAGTGCTQFPEVEAAEPARAAPTEYPRLVPLDPLLARTAAPRATEETAQTLEARAARLRARAAWLLAQPI